MTTYFYKLNGSIAISKFQAADNQSALASVESFKDQIRQLYYLKGRDKKRVYLISGTKRNRKKK